MPDQLEMLRVVVLSHTAQLGGAELGLARLAHYLRRDVDLRVILFEPGPLRERLAQAGMDVVVVSSASDLMAVDREHAGRFSPGTLRRGLSAVRFVIALARRLRRSQSDVVLANSLKSGLIGLVAARLSGRPLVWFVHDRIASDYLPPRLVRLVRWAARRARKVVVNSAATAATLPGIDTTVVYPGFASDQALNDASARVEPVIPTVGIIGRISPTKGQMEFVRAAAMVRAQFPDVRFRVVGAPLFGGEVYLAEVQAEVEQLGLEDRITFTGFMADPSGEIDALSVLVHASPTPEPFGQVIVEGMIRMVPVVATAAGGAPEIVGDDRGLLVPPGDHVALAEAIIATLRDPTAARARAVGAYAWATSHLTAEQSASTLAAVLHDAAVPGGSVRYLAEIHDQKRRHIHSSDHGGGQG